MFTRNVHLTVWLAAAALFCVCQPSLISSESKTVPQRFHARIGGFMGYTYEVKLEDGLLQYTKFGGGHESKRANVRPTLDQWRDFRRELDAIGVWQWRAQYATPGVSDGTQWLLDVAYHDRAIRANGSNDYPGTTSDSSGVPAGSKTFSRYLKAVQQLLGGRAFE